MNFTSCTTDQTTGWACDTYMWEGKCVEDVGGRREVNKPLGRRAQRREYVKFDLKEIILEVIEWINLAQDMDNGGLLWTL